MARASSHVSRRDGASQGGDADLRFPASDGEDGSARAPGGRASGGGGESGGGGSGAPPPCRVPHFSPVHVRGGRTRLRRLARHRRRALAAGLAMTAAALAAAGPPPDSGKDQPRGAATSVGAAGRDGAGAGQRPRRTPRLMMTVPVRIADAATVRLLRPGDRVDVVAAQEPGPGAGSGPGPGPAASGGSTPRILASGARVDHVPETPDAVAEGGALVVLSVPRPTAARLAGASATARLAVMLR